MQECRAQCVLVHKIAGNKIVRARAEGAEALGRARVRQCVRAPPSCVLCLCARVRALRCVRASARAHTCARVCARALACVRWHVCVLRGTPCVCVDACVNVSERVPAFACWCLRACPGGLCLGVCEGVARTGTQKYSALALAPTHAHMQTGQTRIARTPTLERSPTTNAWVS
eukprot:6108548-Pleurochrysis_carterae.AAC.3